MRSYICSIAGLSYGERGAASSASRASALNSQVIAFDSRIRYNLSTRRCIMKLNTAKEVWTGRIIAWVIALGVSCAVIFGSAFILGPALFSGSTVSRQIAVAIYCPGAETATEEQGASLPTTTSPTGTYGHTVEITCTFPDGTMKVIRNEEFALKSVGGMFGLGALCGVGISTPILLVPLFLFRKKGG